MDHENSTGAAHMQISVLLDRSRPDSLTTQMVDQIRDAIRCARIGPGTRLPSSRRLSEQLAISRNTVMRAYDLLLMEGIVESHPASGVYVAEPLPLNSAAMQPVSDPRDHIMQVRMPMPLRQGRAQGAAHAARNRLLYDFFPGHPGADLFPLKTWRRLLQANHLVAARGIVADPSRIVIISGIQEGLTLLARLFLARLARNFGDVLVDGDSGGLHVLWHLPPGIPDAVTVEALALRARIGVYSLSSARVHFRRQTALTSRAIILGYAALSPKQIEKGIARLSDAIDDAIDDPRTDMTHCSPTSLLRCCRLHLRSVIWPHDIDSNRLYVARHRIVQSPERSLHDKVARQCRF